MALSSFNNGINQVRIVADEDGQDQKITSEDNALRVAGTFLFSEDSIQTFPTQEYQSFLNLTVCLYKEIQRQLKIMNQHLSSMSDLEDMDVEPGDDEGAM